MVTCIEVCWLYTTKLVTEVSISIYYILTSETLIGIYYRGGLYLFYIVYVYKDYIHK